MKKRLTRGEKWLFASPLLLIAIVAGVWLWRLLTPYSLELPPVNDASGMAFSPDSERLAVFFEGDKNSDYTARVFNLQSHSEICDLATPPSLKKWKQTGRSSTDYFGSGLVSWSSDGNSIVASSPLNIAIWDAHNGKNKADLPYPRVDRTAPLREIRYAADGETLIGEGVPPIVYDAASGKILSRNDASISKNAWAKASENSGLYAVYKPLDKSFKVADIATKRLLWQPKFDKFDYFQWYGDILYVKGVLNSNKILGQTDLLLWDGKTRRRLPSPPIPPNVEIVDVTLNTESHTLTYFQHNMTETIGETDYVGDLIVWDYRANRVLWRYIPKQELFALNWSPNGKWLAAATSDSGPQYRVLLFDQNGKLRYERAPLSSVTCWSSDSKRLATIANETEFSGKILSSSIKIDYFND